MSQTTVDSTPIGTNTTNATMSPIESVPVRTKTTELTTLKRPTESPEQNGKAHVPHDPEPYPSLSDASSKKKKRNNKKKRRKHKKDDLSDPSSSDNSDSSYDSYYRRKQLKRKSDRKKDPIKLCVGLTAKLLTTAYTSKITRFIIDEDLLQRQIYLILVESLEMIFSQYTETCETLLDDPKIGGEDIKDFSKKSIRNILHATMYIHSRRLITEFPVDGIKCIETFQAHCINMNFLTKVNMTGFSASHT